MVFFFFPVNDDTFLTHRLLALQTPGFKSNRYIIIFIVRGYIRGRNAIKFVCQTVYRVFFLSSAARLYSFLSSLSWTYFGIEFYTRISALNHLDLLPCDFYRPTDCHITSKYLCIRMLRFTISNNFYT